MTVANGDVLKAVAQYVLDDGSIVQNVFHFIAEFLTTQSGAAVMGAIQGYLEDIYDDLLASISNTTVADPYTVHKVEWDAVDGQWETTELVGTDDSPTTFTGTGDWYPNQVSGVLTANTARPKSRGRKFLIPFLETGAIGNDIVSAVLTAMGLALNHYIADQAIDVDNRLSPGVPRTAANEFLPFSNGVVNSLLGTQRRRKPGVGN